MTAPPRFSWVLLLGVASGLSPFAMSSLVPALPAIQKAHDAGYAQVQWLISAYLLGLGLSQPLQGLLCDAIGRRRALLAGFTLYNIASALAIFAPTLQLLIGIRFVQAVGVSVGTVATRAMVRDVCDTESAAIALTWLAMFMGVAPMAAPALGGLLADSLGWRTIFCAHLVIGVAIAVWMVASLRETRPSGTAAASLSRLAVGFRELAVDPAFVGNSGVYAASNGASFAFITIGAALFHDLFGMSATQYGLYAAGYALSYTAGAALAGRWVRRFGIARTLRIGIAATAIAALLSSAAAAFDHQQFLQLTVAIAILAAAGGLTSPLALAGAVSARPDLAGVASGFSSSIAMLTAAGFAWLGGRLYNGTIGPLAALLAVAALMTYGSARMARRRG
ncbi:MAG: MFS transporter [Steroidobacteraceae bacterium]